MRFLLPFCLIIGIAASFLAASAQAQSAAGILGAQDQRAGAPVQDIDALLARAAEQGVGVIVIDSNGTVLSQPAADTSARGAAVDSSEEHSALMVMQERAVEFRAALVARILQLPVALNEVLYILRATSPDGTLWAYFEALVLSALMLFAGALVEHYVFGKRVMKRIVQPRIMASPQGYIEKMPFLILRFVGGVMGILVSMAVAYALGFAIFGTLEDPALQFTVTLINIGYFAARFVAGLWRMILSPYLPQYRIPALSDQQAVRLHRWLWMVATINIATILLGLWIDELGLNDDIYALMASVLSGLVVVLNIILALVNGKAITDALCHGRPLAQCSMVVRFLARVWMPVVILYVLFAWVALTYDLILGNPASIPLIAGAYGIVITIITIYGLINYAIERSFARARAIRRLNALSAEEAAETAALAQASAALSEAETARLSEDLTRTRAQTAEEEARLAALGQTAQLNTYEGLARRIAGILAFVAGSYAFFYIWDNDGARMVEGIVDQLLDIMVILFIGYVIYHAFRIWIDSKIAEETADEQEAELGDEGGGSSASRLATLLPLFRNAVLIVVVVSMALIVLMELGVNVGPLFAGAGIVGIAIGFGSQALVRDIFAGAFFLFDDAFRKGEYLDVGNVKGTVEKISVRSFQLRHHLGALHTIPFGELLVITNYSRDWVMMKLPLRVTYDTDVEKVRKLIKKLGQELLEDPVIGEDFLQPLKSQGVIEMQDSAMIIRVKFMTKPGDQWIIRKRVYEEIRELFQREGIQFAHREVTVRLKDGKVDELSEAQKQEVASAANAAIEDDEMTAGTGSEGSGDDR